MKIVLWIPILWLLFSCDPPAVESVTDERHIDVAGTWYIDQPMHALYEATIYTFHGDGRISTHDAFPPAYHTGAVGKRDQSISCVFAGPWSTQGAQWLFVGLSCSDGNIREVLLRFEQGFESCGGESSCQPMVHSVDGDTTNWVRNWPEWMWTRCIDLDDCRARLSHWTGI